MLCLLEKKSRSEKKDQSEKGRSEVRPSDKMFYGNKRPKISHLEVNPLLIKRKKRVTKKTQGKGTGKSKKSSVQKKSLKP